MLERKDWIVPVFNGKLRTDKPALEYFAMMSAYVIGGVNESSARFFSAVCGLLLVLFTFLIARSYLGRKAAWWVALSLLASIHFIVQFRLATPDPYLILADTLALYCFIKGWTVERWKWWALMYILLGMALLAKGPVGLLLPGLIIFVFLILKRSLTWKTIVRLRPWWGALLVLAFSAPWYILVHIKTDGAWTRGFFLEHNIDRFGGAMGGHGGIFLLTFLFVFVGMLPFSVFIIQTMKYTWRQMRQNDLLLLSFISFVCIVAFYAASRTKLINYTVPCYPFIAIMTGACLSEVISSSVHPKGWWVSCFSLLIICVGLPVGAYFWTQSLTELQSFGWISWFFIFFPLGTLSALYFLRRKQFSKSSYMIAGSFMLSAVLIFAYPYPVLDAQTPMRKAQDLLYKDRPIAAWQKFNDAFVYYARHPIPVIKDSMALEAFLKKHENALIISDTKNQEFLESKKELELIRRDHEIFNSHTSSIYQQKAVDRSRKDKFK